VDSAKQRGFYNPLDAIKPKLGPVEKALEDLEDDLGQGDFLASIGLTRDQFQQVWKSFRTYTRNNPWLVARESNIKKHDRHRQSPALQMRLRHLFYAQVFGGRFTRAEVENQKELADLRHPAEWFPATRALFRTVHLHVGPTNSGKTYHALKRLEEAETGIYLGPLRLLAHEVYTRMNAKGKPCALVTGEEQRLPEDAQLWSCTVEMAPFNHQMDVAVIDEIQMINDKDRGWAWTQALLGLQARELHLCGEARTVPLIRELCALVGDKLVVHEYERLTPLRAMNKSLAGNLTKNLQKGDCIVSFSVLGIHALRRDIEKATGKKCAIVYGSLPPETRAQQARLFNDPDNDYDFLVASNAIGMGLNLYVTLEPHGMKIVC
jgi:ATP-dependent RNA helicase SUPV3L1/SUV3